MSMLSQDTGRRLVGLLEPRMVLIADPWAAQFEAMARRLAHLNELSVSYAHCKGCPHKGKMPCSRDFCRTYNTARQL